MPSVNVVNGKQIVVENLGLVERTIRFFYRPFGQMWHHRDLIQAILRREVAERFKGSVAGWVWAVVAPLLAIAVYTLAFSGRLDLPKEFLVPTARTLATRCSS
jgi:lipopolysaccharide transport system permease protein